MKFECVEITRKCKQQRKINGTVFCALPHDPFWFYPKGEKGFNYNVQICSYDRSPEEIDLLITQKVEN